MSDNHTGPTEAGSPGPAGQGAAASVGGAGTWRIGERLRAASARAPRWPGIAVLVVLADLLFWHERIGLSLAVFVVAIFVAGVSGVRPRRALAGPAALMVLGALPVVEHVQLVSVAFLLAALAGALAWARLPDVPWRARVSATGALLRALFPAWLEALAAPVGAARRALSGGMATSGAATSGTAWVRAALRDWALPVGGVCVFAALLVEANPVLEQMVALPVDLAEPARRCVFWAGIALLCWPFLDPALPGPARPARPPLTWTVPGMNPVSVLRALVLFNLTIGVQTVLDLSILTGGAALPEGMSYAAYAHRGAYPLLATALLAGAFALAARRYLDAHRMLMPLMLLWLGQNVLLSLSALMRLELYIDAYGLTHLRVRALIWMALVAAGLALTGWQVARRRSNGWLVIRAAALGIATLYVGCFVNFAAIIAAQNLTLPQPDIRYVSRLGPTAAAAVAEAMAGDPELAATIRQTAAGRERLPFVRPRIEGWRDWGFRKWRVRHYLQEMEAPAWRDEDTDRR